MIDLARQDPMLPALRAEVAELVDALDSKSSGRKAVSVRARPSVQNARRDEGRVGRKSVTSRSRTPLTPQAANASLRSWISISRHAQT